MMYSLPLLLISQYSMLAVTAKYVYLSYECSMLAVSRVGMKKMPTLRTLRICCPYCGNKVRHFTPILDTFLGFYAPADIDGVGLYGTDGFAVVIR